MTRIVADISVSLDGFVTGPDPAPDNGLGTGGEALHTWAFSDDPDDRRYLREGTARSGAVVLGRRLFDVVDRAYGWDDTSGYGASQVGKPAFVIVTRSEPKSVRLTDLDWPFVTTGLRAALAAARERAEAASSDSGKDLDVDRGRLAGGSGRSAGTAAGGRALQAVGGATARSAVTRGFCADGGGNTVDTSLRTHSPTIGMPDEDAARELAEQAGESVEPLATEIVHPGKPLRAVASEETGPMTDEIRYAGWRSSSCRRAS